MTEFKVIDLQPDRIDLEPKTVEATTAEDAAHIALGVDLVRSGPKQNLRARVYFQHPGQPMTMVRLYSRNNDPPP